MTEAEWLAATDPNVMSRFLCDERGLSRKPVGRRKLRLYACACCRRAWHLLDDERSREAIETAESYADGTVPQAELDRVWHRGQPHFLCSSVCDQIGPALVHAPDEASFLLGLAADGEMKAVYRTTEAAEQAVQVALLRDIFGNPFRPVAVDPRWLTSDVVALARGIYEGRAFDRLPILADALQDAGCENADILGHCRDPQLAHIRGCWVVDLVLGKQ